MENDYDLLVQPWYVNLIDDLKDISVETEFSSRWALVEGRHLLGSRILEGNENFQRLRMTDSELVQRIAQSIKRSRRTVYYSMKFAKLYPDLNLLPEGKNLSWSHLVNKYLTVGEDKPVKITPTEMIRQIKQLLQHKWETSNRESLFCLDDEEQLRLQKQCEFIRYLQDQIEEIVDG